MIDWTFWEPWALSCRWVAPCNSSATQAQLSWVARPSELQSELHLSCIELQAELHWKTSTSVKSVIMWPHQAPLWRHTWPRNTNMHLKLHSCKRKESNSMMPLSKLPQWLTVSPPLLFSHLQPRRSFVHMMTVESSSWITDLQCMLTILTNLGSSVITATRTFQEV